MYGYMSDNAEYIKNRLIPYRIDSIKKLSDTIINQPLYLEARYIIEYNELGILHLILGDVEEAKNNFLMAVKHGYKYFEMDYARMAVKKYNPKIQTDSYIEEILKSIFFSGEAANHHDIINKILQLKFFDDEKGWMWEYYKNRAYCKLVLNIQELNEEIEYFQKAEKRLQPGIEHSKGFSEIFSGFLNNRKEKILQGLEKILLKYNRNYKREEEYPIAPDPCIIICLSKINNIEIKKSDLNEKFWKHIPDYIFNLY